MFSVKILAHIFLISFWQDIRIERSRQMQFICVYQQPTYCKRVVPFKKYVIITRQNGVH